MVLGEKLEMVGLCFSGLTIGLKWIGISLILIQGYEHLINQNENVAEYILEGVSGIEGRRSTGFLPM